jgi:hypothetical protein
LPLVVSALTTSFVYARRVFVRALLVAAGFALALAAPAAAAEISLDVERRAGVRLGNVTELSGAVTQDGAPLAGRRVALEVRRHPYKRAWRQVGRTKRTGVQGRFEFARDLDRNHQVRARLVGVAPEPDVYSAPREAYVLPAFTLTFDERRGRRLRLRQVYTVPRDAELSAPTRFYVGPCKPDRRGDCSARRAELRATAATRELRAGRYVATATVRLPKSFDGRFQYVSCFVYSPGSGMGDPDQRCPRRFAVLR